MGLVLPPKVDLKKAKMGVLITLYAPTKPMMQAAREAEYYTSPTWGHKYPRIQIITIKELFAGKKLDIPIAEQPYQRAR